MTQEASSHEREQLLEALDEFLRRLLSHSGKKQLTSVVEKLLKLRKDRLEHERQVAVAMVHAFSEEYWREYCRRKSPASPSERSEIEQRVRKEKPQLRGSELESTLPPAGRSSPST